MLDFKQLHRSLGRRGAQRQKQLIEQIMVVGLILCFLPALLAESTKVASRVFNGYSRTTTADGEFSPETYVMVEGGFYDGETIASDQINTLPFATIVSMIRQALARQNYLPSQDPTKADLAIFVSWGTTRDTKDKPIAYPLIEKLNAQILGFQHDLQRADDVSFASFAQDFYDEFRSGRYFVVLKAFDFPTMHKDQHLKVLWESRFSIRRQATNFATELPRMALEAAQTFGHPTHGIFRGKLRAGTVEIGKTQVLEEDVAAPIDQSTP